MILDTETTGTRVDRDQILELALDSQVWRFRPAMPIPAEATAVHGITDADVQDCPAFGDGPWLEQLRAAPVIIGYGLRFDIEILQAELARAGLPLLDLTGKRMICVFRLWQHLEPRSLSDAVRHWTGQDHTAAHSAAGDTAATGDVLRAMLAKSGLDEAGAAAVANPFADWYGGTSHILWRDNTLVLGFGKHKGTPVIDVDPGYLRWAIDADFPPHVHAVCRAALGDRSTFIANVAKRAAGRGA